MPVSAWRAALQRVLETAILSGRACNPANGWMSKRSPRRYGVSRTPVREAFRALAAVHLVQSRGRLGVTVRALDVRTLIEMFQVMAELEGLCARLAARRLTRDAAVRCKAHTTSWSRCRATATWTRSTMPTRGSHEAVYEASQNTFLAAQTRALRNQVAGYRRRVTHSPNRIRDTLDEHEQVLQAILDHDGERSHRMMRDHVNLLGDTLVDFLATFS